MLAEITRANECASRDHKYGQDYLYSGTINQKQKYEQHTYFVGSSTAQHSPHSAGLKKHITTHASIALPLGSSENSQLVNLFLTIKESFGVEAP